MNNAPIDFEGNFGSQDPALQPTAETFAFISKCIREHKQRQTPKVEDRQPARAQHKKAA